MELFDTILNELGGSPSDALDGGGSLGDDAGNSSWGDALSGLFGGDDAAGGDGGGWSGALSGLVDRLSGDGDRDSVFSGLADRVSEFVPAGIRDAAGSLFSAEGGASGAVSSWVGSLLEPAAGETAASGGSVADQAAYRL